jgi:hypothetical protein
MILSLYQEANEITFKLLRIETDSSVLHAENAVLINDRGEERVVYISADVFGCRGGSSGGQGAWNAAGHARFPPAL